MIADAEAAVKAAEDAYQAADDALKAALDNDGVYSQAEVDALTENLADAQAAKDAAQDAVDALPSAPAAVQDAKDGLQDRLDALTDITIPAVNDADTDGNGIADVIDDLIADAEAAVKAAEDARIAQQEILENLTDANSNGVITPEEYAAAEAELAALQAIVDAAKDAAQEAVDALPSAPAAVQDAKGDFQDRIDAIAALEIPAVTLLDAIDDEIELDLGSIETSPWDEVKEVSELAVIDLGLINIDAAGLEFSVPNKVSDQGKGHTGNVTITVSQSDLVAVASGFSVHVVQKQADGSWKTITVATVEDGLIADALGLDILGVVDDGNTVALELKNLPEGEYKAIVANDESAIRSLVDDLSLEELGENGILLGKDNQDAVLNAVEIALNGNFIGLGTAVKGVLAPLLLTADTLGVGQIVGAVTAIPLVKTLLGGVIDPILDAIADALVDNLISILKKTDITAIGEEIHFSNLELTNNVLENDISENTSTVIQINGVDVIAGVPTIVQGQYGSLSIESNGTFTYISNGLKESSGKSETFTYTISDGIRTDDANLIINIKDIVAPDAPIINPVNGEDTITGIDTYFMGTGADTVVFSMLVGAETDDTGGNGHDTWTDFSLTEGDRIDVNALLQDGLSKLATDSNYVGNYIKVNTSGNDTVIRIDRDGSATDSTYTETELLTLKNVNTTLQELLDNNQLLF